MNLFNFLVESNEIEGINREPSAADLDVAQHFLQLNSVSLKALKDLQAAVAPRKPFRDRAGLDVRVGNYVAPRGGPEMVERVENLLLVAHIAGADPWAVHCTFED